MIDPNGGAFADTARSLRWDGAEGALHAPNRSHLTDATRPVDFGPRPTSYVPVQSLARMHDEATVKRRAVADLAYGGAVSESAVMSASLPALPSDLPQPSERLHSYMAMLKALRGGTTPYVVEGIAHRARPVGAADRSQFVSSAGSALLSSSALPQRNLTSPMPTAGVALPSGPGARPPTEPAVTKVAGLAPSSTVTSLNLSVPAAGGAAAPAAVTTTTTTPAGSSSSSLGVLAERIRLMLERDSSDQAARKDSVRQTQLDKTIADSHSVAYRTEEFRRRFNESGGGGAGTTDGNPHRASTLLAPPLHSADNSLQVSPIRSRGDEGQQTQHNRSLLPSASAQYVRALETRVSELEAQHRSHQSFVASAVFDRSVAPTTAASAAVPGAAAPAAGVTPSRRRSLAPPPILLARVTLPFLVKGADPAAAPSFVVQVADLDQTGASLLAYLVQQARIRFPHAWESSGRNLAASSQPSEGFRRSVHPANVVLYCAGPADLDVPPPGTQYHSRNNFDQFGRGDDGSGALLHVDGASLCDYAVVKAAEERCTSGTVTAAMRRTLLASRTLQHVAASDVPPNPVLGSSELLTGHLFDLELFIFERDAIPAAQLSQEALRRALLPSTATR